MRCPLCLGPDTKVLETRLVDDGAQVRRRRECLHCAGRFTSFEYADLVLPRIVKRDGSREAYNEEKVRIGMLRALQKRPVPTAQVEAAIRNIRRRLLTSGQREVPGRTVGEWVMEALHALDEVAYVRFASVYRRFQDIEAFREEIERLKRLPSKELQAAQIPLLDEEAPG